MVDDGLAELAGARRWQQERAGARPALALAHAPDDLERTRVLLLGLLAVARTPGP